MRRICVFLGLIVLSTPVMAADVNLFAAGSLKSALGDVSRDFEKLTGHTVHNTFAPSGLLRQRIEKGEPANVFASANMKHPEKLFKDGKAGPVTMFARNKLCAIAQDSIAVDTNSLLDVMLDPKTSVGTSTPKADPSGDYAWKLFEKANAATPGAFAILDNKAQKLTGGPTSEKAPKGRNQYGWVMETRKPDIFLTYCTNAVLAQKDFAPLKIVTVPDDLSVGASYGITVIKGAPAVAEELAAYILSDKGQKVLRSYGFDAPK